MVQTSPVILSVFEVPWLTTRCELDVDAHRSTRVRSDAASQRRLDLLVAAAS